LLSVWACAQRAPAPQTGSVLQHSIFDRYSPLSRNEEIARRALTPLMWQRGQQMLAATGRALHEQPIDLTKERFAVYVPGGAPPKDGYGLLVFIPPSLEAAPPPTWGPPLDRHGLIFVSAANSGNEANVLERRLPLALLAYENMRARYPLNPSRVYVGGFSGGSRAAERTALAYPDVFRGALLNAGSDPIGGEAGIYLPPAELFRKFQETKLAYVTGDDDHLNLDSDQISRASMRGWCVFNIEIRNARKLGHEPLDASSLNRALDALERPSTVDAGELARCNARLQRELAAKVADVEMAITRGATDEARAQVNAIDATYGGLAAPGILDLDAKIATR
jgi:hypothetical protein